MDYQMKLFLLNQRREIMSKSPVNRQANESKLDGQKHNKNVKRMLVQIEYCTNCEIHPVQARHSSSRYQAEYQYVKKRLAQNGVYVRKRQLPSSLSKKSPYTPSNIYFCNVTNTEVHFPEIGSFEVYFNNKMIYSKLETKRFPNPDVILADIYKAFIENNDCHFYAISSGEKRKKKSRKDRMAETIIKQQSNSQSLQIRNLQICKERYFRIKQKLEDQRKSQTPKNTEGRPNTTHIYRRSFDVRNIGGSRRQYYSRGHQKTNEELLNDNYLDVNIKTGKGINHKNTKQISQYETSEPAFIEFVHNPITKKSRERSKNYSDYSVYLQSLIPKKNERTIDFQANKLRLRKKIKELQIKQEQEKEIQGSCIKKHEKKSGDDNDQNEEKNFYADLLDNMGGK